MLKGKSILEDAAALVWPPRPPCSSICSPATRKTCFSYWRGKREHEVDLVAEVAAKHVPFEVPRAQHTGARVEGPDRVVPCSASRGASVVTKRWTTRTDAGLTSAPDAAKATDTQIMRVRGAAAVLLDGGERISTKPSNT